MQRLVFDPEKCAWYVATVTENGTVFQEGDELSAAGIAARFDPEVIRMGHEAAIEELGKLA